jgi:hypothetical protein
MSDLDLDAARGEAARAFGLDDEKVREALRLGQSIGESGGKILGVKVGRGVTNVIVRMPDGKKNKFSSKNQTEIAAFVGGIEEQRKSS